MRLSDLSARLDRSLAAIDPCALRWRLTFFSLIVAVNLFIYYPSFFHMPRGDQWAYLIDTAGTEGWWPLVRDFFSYNRVRTVWPGDAQLFRPVLFLLLGTEKWLFGAHFFWWQATGLVLHLTAVWWLLKLLLRIQPSLAAPLVALHFSTLHLMEEMVVWHHINGYLLFMVFIVMALYYAHMHVEEGQSRPRRLAAVALCLLLASFTFEAGIFFTLLIMAFLLVSMREGREGWKVQRDRGGKSALDWKWILVLLLPIVLYVAADTLDAAARGFSKQGKYEMIFQISNLGKMAFYLAVVPGFWFFSALLPSLFGLLPGGRLRFDMPLDPNWAVVVVNAAALLVLFAVVAGGVSLTVLKKRWKFIALLMALFFCFAGIIVLGRFFERGLRYALSNTYYFYIAWVFFSITLYSMVDMKRLSRTWSGYLKWAAAVLLVVLSYMGCAETYALNRGLAEAAAGRRILVEEINRFVGERGGEPGFSFAFLSHPSDEQVVIVDQLEQGRMTRDKPYYFTDILYRAHIDKEAPKYILAYEKGKGLRALSPVEARLAAGAQGLKKRLAQAPIIAPPRLVEQGYKEFDIFFYAARYYAVEHGSLGGGQDILDLEKPGDMVYEMRFKRESLAEVKALIDKVEFFRAQTLFGRSLESVLLRAKKSDSGGR